MSEIRLVRCPKCDKVLPEPPVFTVYQCGGCGCMLRAKKKKSSESENLVNFDKEFDKGLELEEGVKELGSFDMGSRSPLRSEFGEGSGSKSPMEGSDLNEFHGGLPKSPMRERFLNDLSSSPVGSRNVRPSPMRGRGSDLDVDGVDTSQYRSRKVSMSPLRDRGNRSPMSVRTRNVSSSPLRGVDSVKRSPAGSLNGKFANSPLREDDVCDSDGSAANEQVETREESDGVEKGMRRDMMTPKTSFNTWLSDDNDAGGSTDNGLGRRRYKWSDRVGDDADQIRAGKESVYADEHGMTSEGSVDDRTQGDMGLGVDYVRGNRRPRTSIGQRFRSDGTGMMHGNSRVAYESGRNSASSSTIEGPATYSPESNYRYGHSRHKFETSRGPVDVLHMERSEFIQNYKGAGDHSEEEHLRFRRGSMQQFLPYENIPRSSYYDNEPGPIHEMEDVYSHYPLYEDPYAGPMGNEHFPKQSQFSRRAMPGYAQRQSLDFDRDSFKSYQNEIHRNHHGDWQGRDLPSSFRSRISHNIGAHPISSHSANLQRPGPRTYDPRMAHTSPRDRPSHPTRHARRALVASQNKRICLPIAGGAPFVLCHSCFELLKLPGKFMTKQKTEYKLQCGACSSINSFDFQNMFSTVLSSQKKPDALSAASEFAEDLKVSSHRHRHDSLAATSTNFGSYDFDAGRHSFQSMESDANGPSRGRRLLGLDYDGHTRGTSSSRLSKEELISDNASIRNSEPNSSEMLLNIRPPPGSPLREHLDYSNQYQKVGAGKAISYTGNEKQELERDTSQESSVLTREVSAETEPHSHDLPTSLSDSGDVPGEYKDNNRDTQSSRSPFWRPFGSRSVPSSPGNGEVSVNGQLVPHNVVKKAEKLAGSIEPGDYWYDPKAGFWGAMGHHCLGIIPPSIPEFSFPLPESCCKGDTAVYVNGRELHQKDLDLLATRGLPTMKEMRYIVDISGKVLEESSKDFIVNLGKLAPTVEKNKRGFGMRIPEKLNG